MEYTSFRIKRETYQRLRSLREQLKFKSIDEVINQLLNKVYEQESNLQ